jgi:lysyl-tRNA synthetase class II
MLEYYQIGSDYINIMDITEKYIKYIYERLRDKKLISTNKLFTQPFSRISYQDLFTKYSPLTNLTDNEPQLNQDFLNNIDPQLKKLNQPIFITDYPTFISPLATPKPCAQAGLATSQRFELYFGNLEIANGNTENIDPQTPVTWQNLPACAGCGLGIDRLAMLLTGSDHINQVIPFPL